MVVPVVTRRLSRARAWDVGAGRVDRAGQQGDQGDGLAVERAELHRLRGATEGDGQVGHGVGLGVGDGKAAADAGAALGLAVQDRGEQLIPRRRAALRCHQIDQFGNRLRLVGGGERELDQGGIQMVHKLHASEFLFSGDRNHIARTGPGSTDPI